MKRKSHEISSDSDSGSESGAVAVEKSPKRKRARMNSSSTPQCSKITNPLLSVTDVGADDEIWLMKVPVHFKIDALHDQILNLSGSKKKRVSYESGGLNYFAKVEKKKSKLPSLLPDSSGNVRPVMLDCKGRITLVENVEVPPVGEIVVPPKKFVQQPSDLKTRHPFFGPSEEEVKDEPLEIEAKAEKKTRKKKKGKKSKE